MTIITVSRAATPDEIAAEMDRRGAVIERLETDLRHWRKECGKLHSQLDAEKEKLALANTGGLSLLYDIRRELGWNDKTSLSMLAIGVGRVRQALSTPDTPPGMDLEELARAVKSRAANEMSAEIERLREEVAFWRRDALARLQMAIWAHGGAATDDNDERAADIRVTTIMPTLAAWDAAEAREWHERCEICGEFLRETEPYGLIGTDDGGGKPRVHAACAAIEGEPYPPDPLDPAVVTATARKLITGE